MSDGGLSIGVLSGRIDLDDNFTATINISNEALDELQKRFGGTHDSAIHVAEGMFTAEAAMAAVKEVAYLLSEALQDVTVQGAKIAEVEQGFNRLTLATGELGDELLGSLKQGTHDTLTDFALMQRVNDNLAAGVRLTQDQYSTLATGAFALAKAKGLEVADVFDRINASLETGRVKGVANLIGKIDMAAAEDAYATKLGTSADRLTALEKQEAVRVAILDKVAQATSRLGDTQDGLNEMIQQSSVRWKNFEDDLGKAVATSPAILQDFNDIKDSLEGAFGSDRDQAIKVIVGDLEGLATVVVKSVEGGVGLVKFMVEYRSVLEPVAVGVATYVVVATGADLATVAWAGSIKLLGASLAFVASPIGVVAIGAAAMYAAFEIGHWQPISDFFEKLGLETFGHMTSEEAKARIEMEHLADSAQKTATQSLALKNAEDEIKLATMDWHAVLLTIDGTIVDWAEHLLASGVSAKSVAAEYGLTDVQVKALEHDLAAQNKTLEEAAQRTAQLEEHTRMSRQEMKQFIDTWASLTSLGSTFADTLDTINPKIRDSVQYYADLGAKVDDLVKAFPGLTKAQAEAAVQAVKSAQQIAAVNLQTFVLIAKMHGDSIDDFVKAETTKYNMTMTLLKQQGLATAAMLDAEKEKFDATIDSEIQKRAAQIEGSKAMYQADADAAKAKLDLMLADTGDFTDAQIRKAREEFGEKERLLEHWASDANDKLVKHAEATQTAGSVEIPIVNSIAQAWDAVAAGADASKIKVRLLDDEVVSLEEAMKKFNQGSTFTYDLTTQAGVNQYRDMNQGMAISWNDQQIIDFAKKGGTLQQLMQMGVINMKPLQGFAEGGAGDFGSGTAVMLHGKEVITPVDKVGGMGNISLNFNVYGNTVQQTQQVKDIIMRELKTIKQFGAA